MKKILLFSLAFAAMFVSTVRAEYVKKARCTQTNVDTKDQFAAFDWNLTKQYRFVGLNDAKQSLPSNPTPYYLQIESTVATVLSKTTSGDLDALNQRWVIEPSATNVSKFNLKNVGTGKYINRSKFGEKRETPDTRFRYWSSLTSGIDTTIAFFTIVDAGTVLRSGAGDWKGGEEGYNRSDMVWAIDELDPSTASPSKLALSVAISDAKTLALTVLPENEYLNGYSLVLLNSAITSAQAVYDNGTSTDDQFQNAKTTLETAIETFSTTVQYWTDLQLAITNAQNRVKFVSPKTVDKEIPGFLEFSKESADYMTQKIEEFSSALSQFNANGTSIEEIASPVIEAKAALEAELSLFNSSRGLPDENAWYVIYSFGAPGGYVGKDRWIMNMSRHIYPSTTIGGDTTEYRINRVYSPRELFADSVYTGQYKQKPIMHPNDSMLWKITYVEHESGPRYNIVNKANSDSDNQVYLCTDISIDGKTHQGTGLLNVSVPVKLVEGRDANKTAEIMGTSESVSYDNDNNGWYYMDGELNRSFSVKDRPATDTIFIKQEVGDTIINVYYPVTYEGRAERGRYLWSFQPVDEAGNFFLQTLTPGGVDKAPTAAVKVIASPVPSEDQVTIQLPAGVELVSARLTNMSGQQLMSIGGESFSIAALPAGIYNLTVIMTQGVSSVKVIRK